MKTRSTTFDAKPLFRPRLLEIFNRPYGRSDLLADVMAGVTVGLIALPLALALGIASVPARHADALPSTSDRIIYRYFCRSGDFQPRWKPRADRWSYCGIYTDRSVDHRETRILRADLGYADGRRNPYCHGFCPHGHPHQIHSLAGHERFHHRHRGFHHGDAGGGFSGHPRRIAASPRVSSTSCNGFGKTSRTAISHRWDWRLRCVLLISFWPRLGIKRVPGSIVAMLAAAAAVALFGLEQKLGLETIGSKFGPGAIPLGIATISIAGYQPGTNPISH